MKLINLTPHEVVLITEDGELHIPSSGIIARCSVQRVTEKIVEVDGVKIPINRNVFGEVEGLPKPKEGVLFIVSSLVAQAMRDRDDLVVPDDTVRDEQGRIIGAKALAQI
jgi:hypothetical protein